MSTSRRLRLGLGYGWDVLLGRLLQLAGDMRRAAVCVGVWPEQGATRRCTLLFGEVAWRWAANLAASDGASDLAALVESPKTALARLDAAIEREGELRD